MLRPPNYESRSASARNLALGLGREFDTCPGRGANLSKSFGLVWARARDQ